MADLLWAKFYWTDWLSDIGLRRCSLEARGLWMDMLCIAAQHDPIGYVAVKGQPCTHDDLARICGTTPDRVQSLLSELERNDVFSVDRKGRIYNRRMIAEDKKRTDARVNGAKGGNPKLKKSYNHAGFIYLIGQRQDGAYKIGISKTPDARLKKIRGQYPGQDLQIINVWQVDNMSNVEAELHTQFAAKSVGEWYFLDRVDIGNIYRKLETLKGQNAPRVQSPESRVQSPESRVQSPERETEKASPSLFGHDGKKATRSGTRIPEDFLPDPRSLLDPQFAPLTREQRLREVPRFVDYWRARVGKDGLKADWQATWRNWLRNAIERLPSYSGARNVQKPTHDALEAAYDANAPRFGLDLEDR